MQRDIIGDVQWQALLFSERLAAYKSGMSSHPCCSWWAFSKACSSLPLSCQIVRMTGCESPSVPGWSKETHTFHWSNGNHRSLYLSMQAFSIWGMNWFRRFWVHFTFKNIILGGNLQINSIDSAFMNAALFVYLFISLYSNLAAFELFGLKRVE